MRYQRTFKNIFKPDRVLIIKKKRIVFWDMVIFADDSGPNFQINYKMLKITHEMEPIKRKDKYLRSRKYPDSFRYCTFLLICQ